MRASVAVLSTGGCQKRPNTRERSLTLSTEYVGGPGPTISPLPSLFGAPVDTIVDPAPC